MNDSTIIEVWRQRDAWAREARAGKKRQETARRSARGLGVAGALLGTITGLVEPLSVALGIASAVLNRRSRGHRIAVFRPDSPLDDTGQAMPSFFRKLELTS